MEHCGLWKGRKATGPGGRMHLPDVLRKPPHSELAQGIGAPSGPADEVGAIFRRPPKPRFRFMQKRIHVAICLLATLGAAGTRAQNLEMVSPPASSVSA